MDEEGFCEYCGTRVRRPSTDHVEQSISDQLAAISDRGLQREHNEDRVAVLETKYGAALVVCDGVSSTWKPELAAASVTQSISAFLGRTLNGTEPGDACEIMSAAFYAAATDVAGIVKSGGWGAEAPSTTVVAALYCEGTITIAWAGDSRAYWVDERGAVQLTSDHTVSNDAGADFRGQDGLKMTHDKHAITRWIGADDPYAFAPELIQRPIESAGTLLLCTDGLWNHLEAAEELAEHLQQGKGFGQAALASAQKLVSVALERGGHDNVSVAILHVSGPVLKQARSSDAEQSVTQLRTRRAEREDDESVQG